MKEEEGKLLKKISGILILSSLLICLVGISWKFIALKQTGNIEYSYSEFYEDVFPELFGMIFSIVVIYSILIIFNKSEKIADFFLDSFKSRPKEDNTVEKAAMSLNDSANKIRKAISRLDVSTLNVQSHQKLKEHSQYWNNWRDDLINEDHAYSEALVNAWNEIIGTHLDLENEYLKEKKIKNTSDSFTILIYNITDYLYKEYVQGNPNAKLIRYHVTGMLPEEFFNGPQIEYTTLSSTPLIFCHAFENEKYSNSHYGFQKQKKNLPNLEVHRSIVIQKNNPYIENRYNALSQLNELKNQKKLCIRKGGNSYPISALLRMENNQSESEAERLLLHCMRRVKDAFPGKRKNKKEEFVKSIVDYENYKYYSILQEKSVQNDPDYVSLLNYYSSFFSNGIDNNYYYVVREEMDQTLKEFFRPGYMPEIVLFGLDTNGDGLENKWLLGLQGNYKSFTREIELEIIDPYYTSLCANNIIDEMFVSKLKNL